MTFITIAATIDAPLEQVWDKWISPGHIVHWNFASDDWHTPWAKNDLWVGGGFCSRMEAKDGSTGFDFAGVYTAIKTHKLIEYTIADGRKVSVRFEAEGDTTKVTEAFEAETQNPVDMQQAGWQAILDNFRKYVEA